MELLNVLELGDGVLVLESWICFVGRGGGGGFLEFVDVFVILGMFALFVVLAFSGIFDVFR